MKNLQYLDNFDWKFAIFSKGFETFIKFLSKIWAKTSKNLEIFICRGSEGCPKASEFIKILIEVETCNFDNFKGNFAIFLQVFQILLNFSLKFGQKFKKI